MHGMLCSAVTTAKNFFSPALILVLLSASPNAPDLKELPLSGISNAWDEEEGGVNLNPFEYKHSKLFGVLPLWG